MVAGFYVRKLFRVGDQLEILNRKGTLAGVTPTNCLIASDHKTIAIPNRALLDEIVARDTGSPDDA